MATTSFAISVSVMTVFWGLIGGVIPWFIPKGPNRGWATLALQSFLYYTICINLYLFVFSDMFEMLKTWQTKKNVRKQYSWSLISYSFLLYENQVSVRKFVIWLAWQ